LLEQHCADQSDTRSSPQRHRSRARSQRIGAGKEARHRRGIDLGVAFAMRLRGAFALICLFEAGENLVIGARNRTPLAGRRSAAATTLGLAVSFSVMVGPNRVQAAKSPDTQTGVA
jgi:hypothetical protein